MGIHAPLNMESCKFKATKQAMIAAASLAALAVIQQRLPSTHPTSHAGHTCGRLEAIRGQHRPALGRPLHSLGIGGHRLLPVRVLLPCLLRWLLLLCRCLLAFKLPSWLHAVLGLLRLLFQLPCRLLLLLLLLICISSFRTASQELGSPRQEGGYVTIDVPLSSAAASAGGSRPILAVNCCGEAAAVGRLWRVAICCRLLRIAIRLLLRRRCSCCKLPCCCYTIAAAAAAALRCQANGPLKQVLSIAWRPAQQR